MKSPVTWFVTAFILVPFLIQPFYYVIRYLWKQLCLTALYWTRSVWLSWGGRSWWFLLFAVGEMMFSTYLISRRSNQSFDDPMFVFILGSLIYAGATNFIVQCFDDQAQEAWYNIERDERMRWDETHPKKPFVFHRPFNWLEFNFGWRTLTKITKFVPRFAVRRARKKPLE